MRLLPHRRLDAEPTLNRNRIFLTLLLLTTLLTCYSMAYGQAPAGGQAVKLSGIEFQGLRRYSQEQAEAASGLTVGQTVTPEVLDAASEKLLASGLFKKLSYRLRGSGGKAVVTFDVEEMVGATPVVFDNFVWFTEEELLAAVRQDLPSFDGTAPDAGGMTETITKSLQRLLQSRKIEGRVDYTPSADPSGGNSKHVFSVKGVSIPICSLHFPGAQDVKESELAVKSKPLMGGDYSREFVGSFAFENLIPVYRERGHLRASFGAPAAKVDENADCKGGVSVSVPVEEGVVYSWARADWEGNAALTADELTSALGMKAGELANGLKIDAGLDAVRKAYGKKGYLMARPLTKPSFDDAGRTVAYAVRLVEGPQFHMGNFQVVGLSEGDAKSLRDLWRLKTGDVYDATYMDEFVKKSLRSFMMQKGPAIGRPGTQVRPERQSQTVNVTITFKK